MPSNQRETSKIRCVAIQPEGPFDKRHLHSVPPASASTQENAELFLTPDIGAVRTGEQRDRDISLAVEDYASIDDYAIAMATLAERAALPDEVGAEPRCVDTELGIEPEPGALAQRERITEFRDAINALPNYRPGARIIMRNVSYGPWQ